MMVFELWVKVVPSTIWTLVWYCRSNTIRVEPIRISSPLASAVSPVMRRPLTNVPFLLPRSWMA